MHSRRQALVILISALCVTACPEKCRTVSSVYSVYFNAVVYPELFDTYVQNNQSEFDSDYLSCLDDKIEAAENVVDDAQQICNETFVQGSDFWNACYDDIAADQNYLANISTIRIVTTPGATLNYSQTEAGAYLIIFKQIAGASEYESLMSDLVSMVEEGMECEYCKRRFFLF